MSLNYWKNGRRVPTVEVPVDLLVQLFREVRTGTLVGGSDLHAIAQVLEARATAKLSRFNRSEPK